MISYPYGPFFIAFVDKDMSPQSWNPEYGQQCEKQLIGQIPDPSNVANHNQPFHWCVGLYFRCAIIDGPHIGMGEAKTSATATQRAYSALNRAKQMRSKYMGN